MNQLQSEKKKIQLALDIAKIQMQYLAMHGYPESQSRLLNSAERRQIINTIDKARAAKRNVVVPAIVEQSCFRY